MTSITVALPVYNGMPYLPEAVESVLAQTHRDFRFLIIDDGSTDATGEYLRSLDDPRVEVVFQENRGVGATANRTLEMCDTEYYARMDADDVMLPDRLRLQVEYLEAHPEVVLVGTAVDFLAGRRRFRGSRYPGDHDAILKMLLRGEFAVTHPTMMLRTSIARQIGGYRIGCTGEDADFILRMSDCGKLANLAGVLHKYRIHGRSLTLNKQEEFRRGYDFALVCAMCRRRDDREPEWETFSAEWNRQRTLRRRVCDALETFSTNVFRQGLIHLGSGKPVRGTVQVACSAMLRPGSVIRRLRRSTMAAERPAC